MYVRTYNACAPFCRLFQNPCRRHFAITDDFKYYLSDMEIYSARKRDTTVELHFISRDDNAAMWYRDSGTKEERREKKR